MEKELTVKDAVVPPRKERVKRREVNSMEIFEKRGKWCFLEINEDQGIRKLHKFATKEEAKTAAGWVPPVEETLSKIETVLNGSKEEEESSEEKTSTDEQASVLSSKSTSKKKI